MLGILTTIKLVIIMKIINFFEFLFFNNKFLKILLICPVFYLAMILLLLLFISFKDFLFFFFILKFLIKFYIIFEGYFPFPVTVKCWLYFPCYTIHSYSLSYIQ